MSYLLPTFKKTPDVLKVISNRVFDAHMRTDVNL